MYSPVNNKTTISRVAEWVSKFQIQTTADGLSMVAPTDEKPFFDRLSFPEHLQKWLVDVRLLRHIPLCYLVPDAALLPPESIRFFHVDYTWIDRVTDGAFAAANTGTVDSTFTYPFLKTVRQHLDDFLNDLAADLGDKTGWKYGVKPMTGMLIRSELARRWPDMIVEAYADSAGSANKKIAVLRAEPISKDIYIALFAGQPARVEIREPNVGIRFGVEKSGSTYKVDKRDSDGEQVTNAQGNPVAVPIKLEAKRCLDLADLKTKTGNARMTALHLEQRAYVQIFLTSVNESKGSLHPAINLGLLQLKRGGMIKINKLVAKLVDAGE